MIVEEVIVYPTLRPTLELFPEKGGGAIWSLTSLVGFNQLKESFAS